VSRLNIRSRKQSTDIEKYFFGKRPCNPGTICLYMLWRLSPVNQVIIGKGLEKE
jgi:hypothetical protein